MKLCYVLGVKLVIQIPAWNEAEHLGETLDALPPTVAVPTPARTPVVESSR